MKNAINYMNKSTLIIAITLFAFACSKPAGDKKTQLADLKKQRSEIDNKIIALEKKMGENKSETKVTNVVVTPVKAQVFNHFVEVQGNLDSDNNLSVSPKMGGVITQVPVKVGDHVSAGQVLVVIDDATLRQSMAEIQTTYDFAKTTFEKQQNLWNQKIGSEIQYLQAKNNKESLERRMASLQTQMAMTRVTSPISGTIDAVNVKVGEQAMPGAGVVRVVNLTQMKVKAKVADTYINSIKKGDPVIIKFPDINEEKQARISFAGQVVNAQTRTFDIEVLMINQDNKLKPNLLSVISVNDKVIKNALVIDENLVQNTELGKIVFIAENEGGNLVAKMKKIETGLSYNGKVIVLKGLKEGDQLITIGNQDLVDNQKIKLSEAETSAK